MPERRDLPYRRSIRLKGFDYSHPGSYFVTICAFMHHSLFGRMERDKVRLSRVGEIARACWVDIPNHFPNVGISVFVIMPNHMHGILNIEERARRAVPLRREAFGSPTIASIPTIVRSYKSAVTKIVRESLGGRAAPVWQSNYFERVLRDGHEFRSASQYILENPKMWHIDENPRHM
jgi:putative transposase